MTSVDTIVLAHAGGVDEALGLIVPLLIVSGLWLWSRRRRPDEDNENPDEATPA